MRVDADSPASDVQFVSLESVLRSSLTAAAAPIRRQCSWQSVDGLRPPAEFSFVRSSEENKGRKSAPVVQTTREKAE